MFNADSRVDTQNGNQRELVALITMILLQNILNVSLISLHIISMLMNDQSLMADNRLDPAGGGTFKPQTGF